MMRQENFLQKTTRVASLHISLHSGETKGPKAEGRKRKRNKGPGSGTPYRYSIGVGGSIGRRQPQPATYPVWRVWLRARAPAWGRVVKGYHGWLDKYAYSKFRSPAYLLAAVRIKLRGKVRYPYFPLDIW
jgi:hypothetical protein